MMMNKKLLYVTIALIFISKPIKAQESVGYTSPTDFQYVLDYQLPDWGYTRFYLSSSSLGLTGSIANNKVKESNPLLANSEGKSAGHNFNLELTPTFEYYRESERRKLTVYSTSTLARYLSSNNEDIDSGGGSVEQDQQNKTQSINYVFSLANNYYLKKNTFLITNFYSTFSVSTRNREIENNGSTALDTESINRNIILNPQLGLGIGRIRNVTPIFRAIRMNERYKALGKTSLDRNEILKASEYFTKVQGYRAANDRFLKSFWGDVDSAINGKFSQLNAFDLFYLNDVFDENLGSRFEGYEAYFTIGYSYVNQFSKNIDDVANTENRVLTINRAASLDFNYDWFKNLDLNHQVSVQANNELTYPLERSNSYDWINQTSIRAGWLWNFADRYQLNTTLLNSYTRSNYKASFDEKNYNLNSLLSSNFYYFIENRIAINSGASIGYNLVRREEGARTLSRNSFNWGLNAGISYYFNRNLY